MPTDLYIDGAWLSDAGRYAAEFFRWFAEEAVRVGGEQGGHEGIEKYPERKYIGTGR